MRHGAMRAVFASLAAAFVVQSLSAASADAAGGYRRVDLTSNVSGGAQNTDPNLVNAWGVAFFPGNPFWISDEGTGLSTLYDSHGVAQSLVVTIPAAPEQPAGTKGSPSGIVANPTSAFMISGNGASGPAFFIFDTLDGTISGWNPGVDVSHAVVVVDDFARHAFYTGLAIVKTQHGPRLYAADAANDKIVAFDPNFRRLFSFTDSRVPSGMSAYGVHAVNGRLFVTFASFSSGGGVVDEFDFDGRFIKTFAMNGPHGVLDAPWAVVSATPHFGQFSNDILIGNEANGKISAFDPNSGAFLGQLEDQNGRVFTMPGLWSLEFGAGGGANGNRDELFFTAGPNGYANGLFGKFVALP